jgi:hypothetical protein
MSKQFQFLAASGKSIAAILFTACRSPIRLAIVRLEIFGQIFE